MISVPSIIEDPRDVVIGVGLGRNATFSCSANGGSVTPSTHPLIFTWTGPMGSNVSNTETVVDGDVATSTLTLVNVTEAHEGNYSCTVAYSDMPNITSTSKIAMLRVVSESDLNYCSNEHHCMMNIINDTWLLQGILQ